MKNRFFLLLLMSTIMLNANAQHHEAFRINFGLGATLTDNQGYAADVGVLSTLELTYRVRDDLAIGLRMEGAAIRIDFDEFITGYSIVSYTFNSQYYLSDKKFKPFVGVGFGSYKLVGESFYDTKNAFKIGFYPRVGFDIGQFFMSVDYNIIPQSKTIYLDNITNSYYSMRIGFFIGGGKKENISKGENLD